MMYKINLGRKHAINKLFFELYIFVYICVRLTDICKLLVFALQLEMLYCVDLKQWPEVAQISK